MTEIKKYPPSHKIYSSREGEKACNFIVTQYIKDEVEKGWRLTAEFTLDNWKTKKSILLQDEELVDLYLVLSGKKQEMKGLRKDKGFTCKYQGTHSYVEFTQGEKYVSKISTYDSFVLIGMIIKILSFDLHVQNGRQDTYFFGDQSIIFMLNSLNPTQGSSDFPKGDQEKQEKTQESIQIPHNYQEDGAHCTACGKVMDLEKEAKVIEFSRKKLGRIVCITCQRK